MLLHHHHLEGPQLRAQTNEHNPRLGGALPERFIPSLRGSSIEQRDKCSPNTSSVFLDAILYLMTIYP